MTATCALIVAAGRGARFGGTLPKQYMPLAGSSLLRHAVTAFDQIFPCKAAPSASFADVAAKSE